MKRALLLGLSAAMLMTSAGESYAQPQFGLTSLYYLRPSLVVTAPGSLVGRKDHTNTYSATTPWGGNPDTATIVNIPLRKVSPDSLACSGITNSLTGYYAVVFRGDCEFGAKALAAQQKGARGVIIVNNVAGLIDMGAGAVGSSVTIPVFMISQEDGQAINAQLNAGQNVTISYYRRWGRGFANDLAIAPGSMPQPHARVMPRSQLTTANGSPIAYRNYLGAYIANIGTTAQNSVKLRATTTWYPASGAPSLVRRDSITATTPFTVADSIRDQQFLMPASFQLNPTSNGRYSILYDVSSTATDQSTFDNVDSVTLHVTDSIFCKGGYDFVTGSPHRGGVSYRAGGTNPPAYFTWGPLFYMARSKYRAAQAQFSVSIDGGGSLSGTPDVFVYLYKWTDGAKGAPADSLIEGAELRLVGIAAKTFGANDASGGAFMAEFVDPIDDQKPAIMTDSGWYWVGVQIENSTHFISTDNRSNFHARLLAAQNNVSARSREFWAPQVFGAGNSLDTTAVGATDTLRHFPFLGREVTNIEEISYTSDAEMAPFMETYMPAVALHISQNPVTTAVASIGQSAFNMVELFPNPASTVLNVKFDLADKANQISLHIVNGVGQAVRSQTLTNVKSGTATISTAGLAPGQYYLTIGANGKATARPFTVQGK